LTREGEDFTLQPSGGEVAGNHTSQVQTEGSKSLIRGQKLERNLGVGVRASWRALTEMNTHRDLTERTYGLNMQADAFDVAPAVEVRLTASDSDAVVLRERVLSDSRREFRHGAVVEVCGRLACEVVNSANDAK
jgi:hypothetical protein